MSKDNLSPQPEWIAPVDDGLFNVPNAAPGEMLSRLEDGSRVVLRATTQGHEIVRYLHGPSTGCEQNRLGLPETGFVRVRQTPDTHWATGPCPPDAAPYLGQEIPVELRGRRGWARTDSYKYTMVATVRFWRRTFFDDTPDAELPLIWLEADPDVNPDDYTEAGRRRRRRALYKAVIRTIRASVAAGGAPAPVDHDGFGGVAVSYNPTSGEGLLHLSPPGEEISVDPLATGKEDKVANCATRWLFER
jgi:hypothetical protein